MYRITRTGTYAFNRTTGERMEKPKWPDYREFPHESEWRPAYYRYVSAMKLWDAFVKTLPDDYRYGRAKLTHATEKGVPIPRLRGGKRRKYKNGAGVSANSRILPHRYADEGDKGQSHRREIRRKERVQWQREWRAEQEETEKYGYHVDAYDGPCEL